MTVDMTVSINHMDSIASIYFLKTFYETKSHIFGFYCVILKHINGKYQRNRH